MKPDWLRGTEVFEALEQQGLDRTGAQQLLARAIDDRGIALRAGADASRDLFRLIDDKIDWYLRPKWRPDVATVDWDTLTIVVPSAWEMFSDRAPIEVSREGLAQLAQPMSTPPKKNRRYAGDQRLVDEAVAAIRANKFSNANQAANALADRADGPATRESKVDRLRTAIGKALLALGR